MPYKDPQKAKERREKYKALHPDRHRAQQLAFAVRYRDRKNALHRERRSTPEGKRKDKDARLKANYGITHDHYDAMHLSQGGVCAICRKPEDRTIRGVVVPLVVDHNHKTGIVRALLCHRCNASIGFLNENPDRMRAMAAYVEYHDRRAEDMGA